MKQAAPEIRNLARALLAQETNCNRHALEAAQIALSVFDRLRSHLSKLVGIAGFQALLARALALATAEVSWLGVVRVQDDATLVGFREAAQPQPAKAVAAGSEELLAQLLRLLITFIGEALTLRLIQDIWPEAEASAQSKDTEETPNE